MNRALRVLACVPLLLCLCACAGAEQPAATITPVALAERIVAGSAPLVLDVRTQQEFDEGHIPGARLIPHDELLARIGELAGHEQDEIVVHCKSGRRAAAAEQILRDAGFTRVVDLEGHMLAWQAAGHPTE